MTTTVEPITMGVGDRVRLDGKRRLYTVHAVTEHFACLVQQIPFAPKGNLQYTVIDWRNGIRGACNLIGWGYGDGTYTPEECARMLADFEPGPESTGQLQISHRNQVPLGTVEVVQARAGNP